MGTSHPAAAAIIRSKAGQMPDGCWMVKYANFIQPKLPFFFISFVVLAIARIKSRMDEEAREKRREFILSRLQSFQD